MAHREPLARADEAASFLGDSGAFFAADGRLTDAGVQTWIAHGIIAFTPDVPPETHDEIVAALAERPAGAEGSNEDTFQGHAKRFAETLPPRAEELSERVLSSPRVSGAIRSLVGEGALRSPFKGCVRTLPGAIDQSWHKVTAPPSSPPRPTPPIPRPPSS